MTVLFRKIGVIFTALLLIAATGGYSVFRHYCDCQDAVTTSVFLEVTCGHDHAAEAKSCCTPVSHEKSCCPAEKGQQSKGHRHSDKCCHTNAQFLKINDSFSSGQYKSVDKIFIAAVNLPEKEIQVNDESAFILNTYYSDSSPPLTGRQILLKIHQLKLAPELG
jgi:hypothetical protein